MAVEQVVQSDIVTLGLALMNLVQTLALAIMADRSRRVRTQDRRRSRHTASGQSD